MQLKFTLEEVDLDTLTFDNIRQQFDPSSSSRSANR